MTQATTVVWAWTQRFQDTLEPWMGTWCERFLECSEWATLEREWWLTCWADFVRNRPYEEDSKPSLVTNSALGVIGSNPEQEVVQEAGTTPGEIPSRLDTCKTWTGLLVSDDSAHAMRCVKNQEFCGLTATDETKNGREVVRTWNATARVCSMDEVKETSKSTKFNLKFHQRNFLQMVPFKNAMTRTSTIRRRRWFQSNL
jgi:hypothetical protein